MRFWSKKVAKYTVCFNGCLRLSLYLSATQFERLRLFQAIPYSFFEAEPSQRAETKLKKVDYEHLKAF